jgi:hypothetical protein
MEEEVVRCRGWLTREAFLDYLGATNLIPGPNSTELAIHIGQARAGWPGLLVGRHLLHSAGGSRRDGAGLGLREARRASGRRRAVVWGQAGGDRGDRAGALGTGADGAQVSGAGGAGDRRHPGSRAGGARTGDPHLGRRGDGLGGAARRRSVCGRCSPSSSRSARSSSAAATSCSHFSGRTWSSGWAGSPSGSCWTRSRSARSPRVRSSPRPPSSASCSAGRLAQWSPPSGSSCPPSFSWH